MISSERIALVMLGVTIVAAVWVAWMANKVERDVNVHLKKGALRIQISEDEQLIMSGGADKIMEANPAKALLDQSCCE